MIRILHEADAVRKPWKNGRGVTTEIAISPVDADFSTGDFDWRISRAAVVEDGPFSSFPEHDRVLVLLDGAGLEIEHDDAAPVTLRPFEPHSFRGDASTRARLLSGAVSDFNVFTRRGRVGSAVEVLASQAREITLDASMALVHCVDGTTTIHAIGAARLMPFETAIIERRPDESRLVFRIEAEHATALLVALRT